MSWASSEGHTQHLRPEGDKRGCLGSTTPWAVARGIRCPWETRHSGREANKLVLTQQLLWAGSSGWGQILRAFGVRGPRGVSAVPRGLSVSSPVGTDKGPVSPGLQAGIREEASCPVGGQGSGDQKQEGLQGERGPRSESSSPGPGPRAPTSTLQGGASRTSQAGTRQFPGPPSSAGPCPLLPV